MKPGRLIALIAGCLLLLPGIGLLLGGGVLGLGYAVGRDSAGYFELGVNDLHSSTSAITAPSPTITTDLGTPTWLTDRMRTDVRVRINATDPRQQTFIGIGPAGQVEAYLARVAHDEITSLTKGALTYRRMLGGSPATPPAAQTFWTSTAAGPGAQELDFTAPMGGQWSMVVMNPDGSAGIAAAATFEVKAPFLFPLATILLGLGILLTGGAITLIVVGASGRRANRAGGPDRLTYSAAPLAMGVPGIIATSDHPIVLSARMDPALSRWLWLVKWFLAIPHYVLLAFLWPAFLLVTVIAGFSILFTGRYPRPLFDFTTGVLRWSCRVSYYAFYGGMGTDQYPPFSVGRVPNYPVILEIAYPEHLSRGLVLVKWWLLAIPHYVVLGLLVGNWFGWASLGDRLPEVGPIGGAGVLGLLVVIAGCALLFTGRYPRSLYDLIVGFNRWMYRVIAYAGLLTDVYPPFRLDQGGPEPTPPRPHQPTAGPGDPRVPEPVGTGGS